MLYLLALFTKRYINKFNFDFINCLLDLFNILISSSLVYGKKKCLMLKKVLYLDGVV